MDHQATVSTRGGRLVRGNYYSKATHPIREGGGGGGGGAAAKKGVVVCFVSPLRESYLFYVCPCTVQYR